MMSKNWQRILVVEDDANDLELTVNALRRCKLDNPVETLKDGEECLRYLRMQEPYADREPGTPAVILMDIKMPKMNGIDVLEAIRADETLRHIPVVMLTTSKEETDVAKSYELNANAYVVKPVDFEQFIEAVSTIGLFWALLNEPPPIHRTD